MGHGINENLTSRTNQESFPCPDPFAIGETTENQTLLAEFKEREEMNAMRRNHSQALTAALVLTPLLGLPAVAHAATVANPLCPAETAFFAPDQGRNIIVPPGFT